MGPEVRGRGWADRGRRREEDGRCIRRVLRQAERREWGSVQGWARGQDLEQGRALANGLGWERARHCRRRVKRPGHSGLDPEAADGHGTRRAKKVR